jgi:hypothetical protein
MIGHKLLNKMKSATVAEPKLFHQLNNPLKSAHSFSFCYMHVLGGLDGVDFRYTGAAIYSQLDWMRYSKDDEGRNGSVNY